MFPLPVVRFITTLLSLAILAGAGYLIWSWYDGTVIRNAEGATYLARDDWRLWTGLGLLAWSFVGRMLVKPLLARPDTEPSRADRGEGAVIASPTGSSLHVETHGHTNGPPIILTHGWGMDSTFWWYARRHLGDRFRLILWDLPGLGKSKAGGKETVCLPAFARDLATLIETSGREKVVLVGHSIGGMTIQTLLRDHPQLQDRIAGVVLLNTTYTNPLRTMIFSGLLTALQKPVLEPAAKLMIALQPLVWLSKWQSYLSGSSHLAHRLGFGKFVTRSQLEHVTLLSTRNPPGVMARGDLAMFHWDATGVMTKARVPALIIAGDKDIVTKLEASRTIATGPAIVRLEVIEDVNHMGPMERADIYYRLIGDFVLSVQPSASIDIPAGAGSETAPPYEPRAFQEQSDGHQPPAPPE